MSYVTSLEEHRKRLEQVAGHALPRRADQAPAQSSERHRQAMADLENTHDSRMKKFKSEADAQIRRQEQHRRELVEESKRHRQLLREETMEQRRQNDRVELASRRGHRKFLEALGADLGPIDRQQLEDEITGLVND